MNAINHQTPKENTSWPWLLGLFTFSSFIEAMFFGQLGAFTPLYLPQLGIAAGEVARWTGIAASLSGLVGLPFLPFWGALADRYSRKPVIVRSFAVHLIVGVVTAIAGNIWVFLLGRSLTSMALGNSGLMMTTLSERAPSGRQGLAFSVMNSASPVGVFLGPLIGGPIVDHWGVRALLSIDALLMLTVVLAMSFGYQDPFSGDRSKPLLQMAADSLRIILRSRRLLALFPAFFVLFAGWMLAQTYAPLAITKLYTGADPGTVVGIILGAGGVVALFFSPLLGGLADRYGHWRVLILGALLETALWPLPALTGNLFGFGIAWAILNGVGSGVFALSFYVLSSSTSLEVRGRVMSFAYLPVNIGLILGPALGSVVTHSSVFVVFPVAAVLTLIGIGLLLIARNQAGPTD